jgi:ornithine carbamoyltransferase
MGMIFEKPSLRTHVSFETGMAQLGGQAVYLGPQNIGALDGSRELVRDIASVLTRMCDIVTARVFERDVRLDVP